MAYSPLVDVIFFRKQLVIGMVCFGFAWIGWDAIAQDSALNIKIVAQVALLTNRIGLKFF